MSTRQARSTPRRFALAAAAGLLLALGGCASLPSADTMKAEVAGFQLPRLPDAGKAMVYVVRPSGLGGLVRFNVFVDDQEEASEVGWTRSSQYIYFQVSPGSHRIYSKAENWAEVQIAPNAGEVVFIQQEPGMGIIMARNTITLVPDIQGKYYVKTLSPGTMLRLEKAAR